MLSSRQVAKRLGLSYESVIYNYLQTGIIKSIKLNRVYRVEEKDLEAFIKSREFIPVTK
jgi:excisionase family DNA binding protein